VASRVQEEVPGAIQNTVAQLAGFVYSYEEATLPAYWETFLDHYPDRAFSTADCAFYVWEYTIKR